ncbi:MAG: hypothetical protein GY795_39975 [Desulfobacterales bacterium]|nr:hypothetical protein [Desulfobacterales bacterium]
MNNHKEQKQTEKKLASLIFRYSILFLIIDAVIAILFIKRKLGFFRAVYFLYTINFVLLPLANICFVFLRLFATKTVNRVPHALQNVWRLFRIDKREITVKLVFSLLLLSIFVYATFIEPNNIQIDKVEIKTGKVSEEITILHISDIQSVSVGKYEQKVFQIIEKLNPDLILHTGDLMQTNQNTEMEKMAKLFKQLSPKYGIYHSMGDTDSFWSVGDTDSLRPMGATGSLGPIKQFCTLSGVRLLIDKNATIKGKEVKLNMLGLSLYNSRRGNKAFIKNWKNRSKKNEFTIVFGHAPEYISGILKLDIDLCLAGHTHGGQIRVPFWGPIITLSRFPKKWSMGYRKINNTHINVSAGVGTEHAGNLPPIRFNCPPVMTLLTLKPQTN